MTRKSLNVDPEAEERSGWCSTEGDKVMWATGVDYAEINTKNGLRDVIKVRFTCMIDEVEGSDDVGADCMETFWLTEKAVWRLRAFARAVGHTSPFDAYDEGTVRGIIAKRPVRVTVGSREYNGKTYFDPKKYAPWAGDPDAHPAWQDMLVEAEDRHARFAEWQSGGGSGGGSGKPAPKPVTNEGHEDIPF